MAPKVNVKERYNDGKVDLSMSDLNDVPVKEIVTLKRVYSLDLSNNSLRTLPKSFPTLTGLTVLDLSKNELSELPQDFGNLVKLKHLDLYRNQLQHLPLSFSKLKGLKWLDLKDNPLVPAVAKVAGLCIDTKACQTCAKNIVEFYSKLESQVAAELEMRNRDRQKQLQMNNKKKQEEKREKKREKVVPKKEKKPSEKQWGPSEYEIEKRLLHSSQTSAKKAKSNSFVSSLLKIFLMVLSVYLTIVFVKFKDSDNVVESMKQGVIEDYHKISSTSQIWWKEFLILSKVFWKKLLVVSQLCWETILENGPIWWEKSVNSLQIWWIELSEKSQICYKHIMDNWPMYLEEFQIFVEKSLNATRLLWKIIRNNVTVLFS
ncbi:unnamed protein product [Phyllotreta striolata]|uniref:Leucine-rich repeat-containing protein 59 n=1 Tax=Phyllotreta striolata TaxID=444603 RepID=A0A9N9XV77_PHYSR|nr:unnamed protein product [Phyllotreta striolata]